MYMYIFAQIGGGGAKSKNPPPPGFEAKVCNRKGLSIRMLFPIPYSRF